MVVACRLCLAEVLASLEHNTFSGIDAMSDQLFEALKNKASHEEIKELLENYPESAAVQNGVGSLPLHIAILFKCSKELVLMLLDAFPQAAEMQDKRQNLPLHLAIRRNILSIVELLLTAYPKGARIKNSDGDLPLHIAIMGKDFVTVKMVLAAYPEGAKVLNSDGSSPLHIACRSKSSRIVELLLKVYPEGSKLRNKNGEIPLHVSCRNNDPDSAILLLKTHSEGVKVKDNNGWLPVLHAMIYYGSDSFIKMLFEAYPEATRVKNNEGDLPLHVACEKYTTDIVQFIIDKYQAGTKVKNDAGLLPLHIACRRRMGLCIISKLIETFPEGVIIQDENGNSPLYILLDVGAFEEAQLIAKAYPEAAKVTNNNGDLPLHVALERRAFNAAKWLLKVYPEAASVENQAGNSPLSLLCKKYFRQKFDLDWLDLFISANPVGIDKRDQEGNFPSDILRNSVPKRFLGHPETNRADQNFFAHHKHLFLLHDAIKGAFSKHVIRLILQAFPTSCLAQDNKGMVPMHYACLSTMSNFFENVVILLEFDSCSLFVEDTQGRTPLQYLSADASALLKNDILLVHHIAGHSFLPLKVWRLLIDYFPKSISTPDKRGMLPFHHAALNSASSIEVLMLFSRESLEMICPFQPHS